MSGDEDLTKFGVALVQCDHCDATGDLYRVRQEPRRGEGGDWPEVIVLCESCLRHLHRGIQNELDSIAFSRGLEA